MDKFPSASYKKFASEKDAWAFVRTQSATSSFERPNGNIKDMVHTPHNHAIVMHQDFRSSRENIQGEG